MLKTLLVVILRNLITKIDDLILLIKKKKVMYHPPKTVLLIRWDRIGDAVATLPLINEIKTLWPDAKVDLICSKTNRIVFMGNKNLNKIYVLDGVGYTYGLKRILKFILYLINPSLIKKQLKDVPIKKYDLCFDLMHGETVVAFKPYASFFIGPKSQDGISWIYDYYPERAMAYEKMPLAQYYFNIICEAYNMKPYQLIQSSQPPIEYSNKVASIVKEMSKNECLVNISGSELFRSFPKETLISLLKELSKTSQITIFDDPNQTVLNKIKAHIPKNIHVLPSLTLPELAVVAKHSRLYIGIEGGASHYLAAFCPAMIIFTPKSYEYQFNLWRPIEFEYCNLFETDHVMMVSDKCNYAALLQKPTRRYSFKPHYIDKEPLTLNSQLIIEAKDVFLKSISP